MVDGGPFLPPGGRSPPTAFVLIPPSFLGTPVGAPPACRSHTAAPPPPRRQGTVGGGGNGGAAPITMIRGFPNPSSVTGGGAGGGAGGERVIDQLVDFPSVFTFKVVGHRQGDFVTDITDLVAGVTGVTREDVRVSVRDTPNGKWRSITLKAPCNTADNVYGPRSPSSPRLPWPPRCHRRRCAQRLVGNVPPLGPAVRPSCLAARRVADRPWRARPLATRRRDPPRSLSNPVASPALPAHHERRYSHCRSRVGGCPLPALPHSVLERSLCPASRHRSPCGPPRCPLLRPFWVGRVALAGCWQWGGPRRRFRDPSHPRARWWRRRQRRQWRRRRRRQCRAESRPDVLDASISPPAGRPCFPLFGEPGLVVGTPHRHCSGRGDAQGCMAAE